MDGLLSFVLNLCSQEYEKYPVAISAPVRAAAIAFETALKTEEAASPAVQATIQALLTLLFMIRLEHNADKNSFLVTRYFILSSISREGAFAENCTIHRVSAMLIYIGRAALFREIDRRCAESGKTFFEYAF